MLRAQTMVGALVCVGLLGACSQTGGTPAAHDAFGRPTPTTSRPASAGRAVARVEQPYDATIRAVIADLQQFWPTQFAKAYGSSYAPLHTFYAYGPSTNMPVCDGQRVPYLLLQGNAFYCGDGDDDFIAWDDVGLFPRLDRVYGHFTIALVLAHEWGHAIQHRAEVDEDTIIMEQQADCFAGAWAKHLPTTPAGSALSVDPADLDAAVAGLIGFRDPVGLTAATEGSHGTGFDRVRAFQEGYADGVTRCAAYVEDPPKLVGVAFPDLRSRLFGGDLPFRDVIPSATEGLSAYWKDDPAINVRELAGDAKATCSQTPIGIEGMATDDLSYCPADNTVRWRVDVIRPIYDDIGDFAVATLFGVLWANVHSPGESTDVAFCQTGAWARARFDHDPFAPTTGLAWLDITKVAAETRANRNGSLGRSPGDLDEAVQLLLGTGKVLRGSTKAGTSFARVDALRRGFFDGAKAC